MASDASATWPTSLGHRGDRLAATVACGAPPVYRDEAGEQVRALIEGDRLRFNPREVEVRAGGRSHDTPRWCLASVLPGCGLARAGFRVASCGEPAVTPRRRPG